MKFYIRAMSETKQKVEQDFYHRADVTLEHIMKLVLMPDHESRNHWRKEIATQFFKLPKFKGSNKYPTEKQIFDWTYNKWADEMHDPRWMQNMMLRLCKDYRVTSPYTVKEFAVKVNRICKSYFAYVAQQLHLNQTLPSADTYAFLDEVL